MSLQGMLLRTIWNLCCVFTLSLLIDKRRRFTESRLHQIDHMLARIEMVQHWLKLTVAGLEAREIVTQNRLKETN